MIVLSFFDAVSDWGSFSSGVISISESELLEPKVVDGFVRLLRNRLRLKLPDCVEIFTIAVLLSGLSGVTVEKIWAICLQCEISKKKTFWIDKKLNNLNWALENEVVSSQWSCKAYVRFILQLLRKKIKQLRSQSAKTDHKVDQGRPIWPELIKRSKSCLLSSKVEILTLFDPQNHRKKTVNPIN